MTFDLDDLYFLDYHWLLENCLGLEKALDHRYFVIFLGELLVLWLVGFPILPSYGPAE